MWAQKVEYIDADAESVPPPLVKKQIWDEVTNSFVPMSMYRLSGVPNSKKMDWLKETYGEPGVYKDGKFWDYSRAGDFTVMDQKVYTWYQMKWGNR